MKVTEAVSPKSQNWLTKLLQHLQYMALDSSHSDTTSPPPQSWQLRNDPFFFPLSGCLGRTPLRDLKFTCNRYASPIAFFLHPSFFDAIASLSSLVLSVSQWVIISDLPSIMNKSDCQPCHPCQLYQPCQPSQPSQPFQPSKVSRPCQSSQPSLVAVQAYSSRSSSLLF